MWDPGSGCSRTLGSGVVKSGTKFTCCNSSVDVTFVVMLKMTFCCPTIRPGRTNGTNDFKFVDTYYLYNSKGQKKAADSRWLLTFLKRQLLHF